jgi:hypothetical protein
MAYKALSIWNEQKEKYLKAGARYIFLPKLEFWEESIKQQNGRRGGSAVAR